jgi:hypothetical protein
MGNSKTNSFQKRWTEFGANENLNKEQRIEAMLGIIST